MSKKDYEAFVKELKDNIPYTNNRVMVARVIAAVAQRDNPKFNRSKFFRECGLERYAND